MLRKPLYPLFALIAIIVAMSSCEKPELPVQNQTESVGGGNGEKDNGDEDDGDIEETDTLDAVVTGFFVTTMPKAGEEWNGHVVAYVADDGLSLLLSRAEWQDVPSALNIDNPNAAIKIARQYNEGGIDRWTIPTREEARLLRAMWMPPMLDVINGALTQIGSNALVTTDRYLCESGSYTFSFADNTSVSKAGTKKGYRLRLVKPVRFIYN